MAIVSRLVPHKGVLEALETLRLVKRRLRVAVVGDGLLHDAVRRLVGSLDHSVSLFLGFLRRRSGVYWCRACIIFTRLLPRGTPRKNRQH